MKISYAITVCNELEEIQVLLPFLMENKRGKDEIVILFDNKKDNEAVLEYLSKHAGKENVKVITTESFDDDFAGWKNKLNSYCTGDYIFQLDADEMVSEHLISNLHEIIEINSEIDLFFIPRINTVKGITEEHVKKWRWNVDSNGRVNYPDYQGRVYKSHLKWEGKVHERIGGAKFYSLLPTQEEYSLTHHKSIQRQEKQNELYSSL
jgi:glycosyltransferase involved in cell wall biosynthesis